MDQWSGEPLSMMFADDLYYLTVVSFPVALSVLEDGVTTIKRRVRMSECFLSPYVPIRFCSHCES